MRTRELDALRTLVDPYPVGGLPLDQQIVAALTQAWDYLVGAHEEGMSSSKLDRATRFEWNPPVLGFSLERHRATVRGSSRGTVQSWEVDLDTSTAKLVDEKTVQMRPTRPRLDVVRLATRVVDELRGRKDTPWFEWNTDRTQARLLVGRLPGLEPSQPQQTLASRRKRFREALLTRLPEGVAERQLYRFRVDSEYRETVVRQK